MLEVNDVLQAFNNKINEVLPAAVDKMTQPVFTGLFSDRNFSGETYRQEAMHSGGRFKSYGNGNPVMEEQAFEGGMVSITPINLGIARSWTRSVADKMVAEGLGSLESLVDRWVQNYWATRDIQAAAMLNDASTTWYDGVVLYSTAHKLKSKTQSGSSLVNTDETAGALDADFLQTLLLMHEDTMAYDETGEPIDNQATHLVADARDTWTQLKVLLASTQKAGTAMNDVNPERGNYTPVLWRRLASGQSTHYVRAVSANGGLIFVNRTGMVREVWYDAKTSSYGAKSYYEGKPGVENWRATSRKKLS